MNIINIFEIGDLVSKIKTWNPARSDQENPFEYIDLSSINQESKQIESTTFITPIDAPSRARQLVSEGDILVSTVRPNLNGVAYVTPDFDGATASTGFCVLRPQKNKLHSRYLFHWVKTKQFIYEMIKFATGANYPAVSDGIIKSSKIPLPPLPEQKRIAAILDKADAIRRKRQAAITLADDFLRATFLDMFGDPVTNPKRWDVRPLKSLIDTKRPITYGILKPGPNIEDGVPYIRVVDMGGGGIKVDALKRTSFTIAKSYNRSKLKPFDILLSIRGHVGRLAIVPEELNGANITQDTARLSPVGCNHCYLFSYLQTKAMQHLMARFVKGVAVKGINLGDVKELPILLPPNKYQEKYSEIFKKFTVGRGKIINEITSSDLLFKSACQRAFRGDL